LSVKLMAKAKMDENGKVQIPLETIKKLGLKNGTEFELKQDNEVLVLKQILPKKSKVKSPPLSASEKMEIEESEKEFATQTTKVYDNASDLLNALHTERKRAKS
jgi:bifunctional DNA-binding transcriptional regulator/antitoxin component of YhaV-PrlF toxin-antitoxin module